MKQVHTQKIFSLPSPANSMFIHLTSEYISLGTITTTPPKYIHMSDSVAKATNKALRHKCVSPNQRQIIIKILPDHGRLLRIPSRPFSAWNTDLI